jgi:dTDP-glucose 4,6-dehydratase
MKLMVTGGAGFIGSHFVRYWLENHPGDVVINYDALTYAGNTENLNSIKDNPQHVFIQGDIRDALAVNSAMAGVDMVVHFAAETHVDRSILEPGSFVTTNVVGTQVLLDCALRNQVKRFHHISTDEVFGSLELGSSEKFSETTPYDPRSPYSASKAGSDHLVRAYGETYHLPFSITNCSNNYGPNMFPEKFFPLAVTNLIEDKNIPIYGDGLNVRDWLFVTDHCRAIETIILAPETIGKTYCVGGLTQDVSNLEVAKMILNLMQLPESRLDLINDRPGHDRRYAIDWTKINTELAWKPQVSLEDGLRQTIQWYQQNESWWKPLKAKNQDFFVKNYESKEK